MRKPFGKIKDSKLASRMRRRLSIRKKVIGSSERPRVNLSKSNKHLVAQVVDDSAHKTLFSVQTFGKTGVSGAKANKDGAKLVGAKVAEKLKASNIQSAVFDRGGLRYSGVLESFVSGMRENGIQV